MKTKKNGANYVDGFVLLVPKSKVAEYKKMAREGSAIWKRFGALDYKECKGEDLNIKAHAGMPAPLSFNKLASAKAGDTVWFSFITYKNKAHRNQVNKKVMEFFSKKYASKKDVPQMPFEMSKMAYGGFEVVVSA